MDTSAPARPSPPDSLDQMAEEIFSLSVLSWKQRLAAKTANAELSESQYLTLDLLVHAPGTPTVGELQRTIGVLPAQMSRIIRSLETTFDAPLIRCQLNQNDKRRIDVLLTDEGRRVYDSFRESRLSKTRDILRHLSDHDRAEFVRICRRIRELQVDTKKKAASPGEDA